MFAIIISAVAIVCCVLAVLGGIVNHRPGTVILFFLLAIMNTVFLVANINRYNNPESVETHVVHNVEGYQIDSTLTINGADTTKTYTITYWK